MRSLDMSQHDTLLHQFLEEISQTFSSPPVSVSLTHTGTEKLCALPLTLHLCAMQRYANDSSSEPLESWVNDVCIFECLRRMVSRREGESAFVRESVCVCVCASAWSHAIHAECVCMHACMFSVCTCMLSCVKSVHRHAVHVCVCTFAAVCTQHTVHAPLYGCMCRLYMCTCMLKKKTKKKHVQICVHMCQAGDI